MKKICLPALLLLTSTAIAQEIPSTLPVPSVEQFKKVCTAEKIKKLMIEELIERKEEDLNAEAENGGGSDYSQVTKGLEVHRANLEKNLEVDMSVVSVMPDPLSFYMSTDTQGNIPMQQVKFRENKDKPFEPTSGFYASEKFGCLEQTANESFLRDENGKLYDPSDLFTSTTVSANNSSRNGLEKPQSPSPTPQVPTSGSGTVR
jgi:hypothetical protein